MKVNKIKERLIEGLSLFEGNVLTDVFTQNIREAVLHDDKDDDNIGDGLEDDIEVDKKEKPIEDPNLTVKPIKPLNKVKPTVNIKGVNDVELNVNPKNVKKPEDVSPRERMAQPITDPKINKTPQVKPTNMVGDASMELTARDKGLELSNSDTDIKRIIDSNMMVKIKYESESRDEINTYNVVIYALGTNLKGNRAIRIYNSFGGSANSKSGWKTFLVSNIKGITVSGQHMGKSAISDYLKNAPEIKGGKPKIQGYNHDGDKSFMNAKPDHIKSIGNNLSKPKIKN